MTTSVLDENVPLAKLLDTEGFREVCRSFCELYGIGIKAFDLDGNKLVDVGRRRASTAATCSRSILPRCCVPSS